MYDDYEPPMQTCVHCKQKQPKFYNFEDSKVCTKCQFVFKCIEDARYNNRIATIKRSDLYELGCCVDQFRVEGFEFEVLPVTFKPFTWDYILLREETLRLQLKKITPSSETPSFVRELESAAIEGREFDPSKVDYAPLETPEKNELVEALLARIDKALDSLDYFAECTLTIRRREAPALGPLLRTLQKRKHMHFSLWGYNNFKFAVLNVRQYQTLAERGKVEDAFA